MFESKLSSRVSCQYVANVNELATLCTLGITPVQTMYKYRKSSNRSPAPNTSRYRIQAVGCPGLVASTASSSRSLLLSAAKHQVGLEVA